MTTQWSNVGGSNKYSGGSRISPRRGRQLSGGAPTYDVVNFCRKLHENEEILAARGGARPLRPRLDPPLINMWEYKVDGNANFVCFLRTRVTVTQCHIVSYFAKHVQQGYFLHKSLAVKSRMSLEWQCIGSSWDHNVKAY